MEYLQTLKVNAMKRILSTWLLAVLAGTTALAQTMTDNHQLTALWKQYDAAQKADRPQKEAEILAQIKKEAADKRLPVDFYDAATEYVQTVQRRDWKQQEKLRKDLEAEVKAFDEPIVTFTWMKEWNYSSGSALWQYVKTRKDGLQGCHRPFHKGVSNYLNGALLPFIRSDWEYVLWALQGEREAREELEKEIEGRYPNEAALEYFRIYDRYWSWEKLPEQRKAYKDLAEKYAGKAVSLFPEAQLLNLRRQELDREKGSSAQYKELWEEARALEKVRKAYKGSEAVIAEKCTSPQNLIELLEAASIDISIKEDQIVVVLQNLSKADVKLYENKHTVKAWALKNSVNSFFVPDTLKIPMPVLPDGSYTIEAVNGKLSAETRYTQYTLSIATRTDADGAKVYVADFKTGIPLRSVNLLLKKGDKEIARSALKLDGFTKLPAAFDKAMKEKYASYSLVAQSGDRKSQEVTIQRYSGRITYDNRLRCNIYRDRGAYNPGDVLQFKAIVYNGDPEGTLEVVPGKEVEVLLYDSESNILETKKFTTNEFGAISGAFTIPKGLRGGNFELEVKGLSTDWFRVDEFVLPTFSLSFDRLDQLYMTGDDVPVSGLLTSYSGHSLTDVKIMAKVERYDHVVLEQEVEVQDENRFRFTFPAKNSGYYHVTLTVTDPSGETQSFSRGYYVGDSLSVSASVEDVADADLELPDSEPRHWRYYSPKYVIESTRLRLTLQARDDSGNAVPLPVSYSLYKADGTMVLKGETPSGELLSIDLPENGLYTLMAEVSANMADGKKVSADRRFRIYALEPGERKTGKGLERVFISGPTTLADGSPITARLGTAQGDAYAVVTLYGDHREVLLMETLRVADASVENLSYRYQASWPDAVRMQVFYFIDGKAVSFDREYRRAKDRYALPLRFTRFQDKAYPGVKYSFTLETAADAEVLVAAWDKSMDAIATNHWPFVNLRDVSVESVYVSSVCGKIGEEGPSIFYAESTYRSKAVGAAPMMLNAEPMMDRAAMEEDAVALSEEEASSDDGALPSDVAIRENFSPALAFQPHLRPDANGNLDFEIETSDKLSTFYVRAYAHDKLMRNAIAEGEMLVTLPVKVSLLEPRFLYEGDVYNAAVTVSSVAEEPVSGVIILQAGDHAQEVPVTVKPGETLTRSFRVEMPDSVGHDQTSFPATTGNLILTACFKADEFSDAVRVTVPVYPAAQILTEAHSAVLHAGEDREALLKELRGRFVNVPGAEAFLKDITVLDMVKDAIPSHVEPQGNDVLALSEAWYIRLMASRLGIPDQVGDDFMPGSDRASDLLEQILSCQNLDGGFGWFEGMTSSPVITAAMLERFAKLRERGFEVPDVSAAVKYLDKNQFDETRPYWCGWISDAQYMHIRACYPKVPFEVKPVTQAQQKRWKEFQKDAKSYLTPSAKEGRGLKGQILSKARRLITLRHLAASAEGKALAKAWGIGLTSKLEKSIEADVVSLLEYAVEHRDGGWYYPNAVMPWRGLMESEAYAHALLCDLLQADDPAIADGIRLWLMLQKETQKWDTEPAYIDAITAILDGSEAVLGTRVLALSATYKAPFSQIKAAGNGFTIGRKFLREDGSQIKDGDPVAIGERITVKYDIWNGENRSFVKIDAGREASLTPVQQLSGHVGYGFIRPWRSGFVFGFTPQGYRNVKAQRTEYFFDSYPEEKTSISEEFFVTRAGTFHAPAVTIESLYAPHYRANTAGPAPLVSK